jgi:adenosylhomocysteine nucleosidase
MATAKRRAGETIVAIAAEAREFAGLRARLDNPSPLGWPIDYADSGTIGARRWVLCANGPGPHLASRAVETALEREEPGAVLSTGFCGGLDPALAACDVFVARRILDEVTGDRFDTMHESGGTLISGDRVVSTLPEKAALRQTTGAGAVDMEAAAVARAAAAAGIPLYCVRVVTDTAWEAFPVDFNDVRDAQGRFSRMKIAAAALAKPSRVSGLLQLDRRTKEAAAVLGDYLAGKF